MSGQQQPVSSSISAADRPLIKRTLGDACHVYAAAAIKLYIGKCSSSSASNAWTETNITGALVLHSDATKNDALFYSIVEVAGGKLMWQHECYLECRLSIEQATPNFATFSSDKFLIGFLFCREREAADFVEIFEKRRQPAPPPPAAAAQQPAVSTPRKPQPVQQPEAATKKVFKKINKKDIGKPTNFRLISHIGFDGENGFDLKNIPEEWKSLFEKAGVTQAQLANPATADFIVNFVETRGGPPPIPPRQANRQVPIPLGTPSPPAAQPQPPPLPVRRGAPAAAAVPPAASAARNGLLESIVNAGGVASLKKAQQQLPLKAAEQEPQTMDIASLLAKALAERHLASSSEEEEE